MKIGVRVSYPPQKHKMEKKIITPAGKTIMVPIPYYFEHTYDIPNGTVGMMGCVTDTSACVVTITNEGKRTEITTMLDTDVYLQGYAEFLDGSKLGKKEDFEAAKTAAARFAQTIASHDIKGEPDHPLTKKTTLTGIEGHEGIVRSKVVLLTVFDESILIDAVELPEGELPVTRNFNPLAIGMARNFKREGGKITCDIEVVDHTKWALENEGKLYAAPTISYKHDDRDMSGAVPVITKCRVLEISLCTSHKDPTVPPVKFEFVPEEYFKIIHTGSVIGKCTRDAKASVLEQEPDATFEPITKEQYEAEDE